MRKALSSVEVLAKFFGRPGLVVYDVGCGTGDAVRWMTQQGARVTGVDSAEMLAKAALIPRAGDEIYVAGGAENLPFESSSADLTTYIASLHHVATDRLGDAVRECARVLRPGGLALFIEPVATKGGYTEITRLTGDETVAQAEAYAALETASRCGLDPTSEEAFYIERSFLDYIHLIETFVDEAPRRAEILAEARRTTERLAGEAGVGFEAFRYKSYCRLNVLARRKG